jgi:hypothetical protein
MRAPDPISGESRPSRITQLKAEHGRRHAQIPARCSNERHREQARASGTGTHATHACDAQSRNEWLRLAVTLAALQHLMLRIEALRTARRSPRNQ